MTAPPQGSTPQTARGTQTTRAWRFPCWVALQSLVTSLVLTWPHGTGALGSPYGDNVKHLWNLWVTQKTWPTSESGLLHNSFINYPEGLDLWPIEPLHSLVALALSGLPLIVISNLQVLLNLTLDGVMAALLVREVSGSRLAACAAALLLQGSSFALFAVEVGVGELQHLWLLPLVFWSLLKLIDSPRPGWILITACLLGLAPLACFYHGLFVAIGCTVLALFALAKAPDRRRLFTRLAGAAVFGLLVASLPLQAFSSSYGEPPQRHESLLKHVFDGGPDTSTPPETRLRLSELVTAGHARTSNVPKERAYGGGRLLGIPLILLVLLGAWKNPRRALPWLVMSTIAVLLALGPHPTAPRSDGGLLSSDHITLPFHYLNRLLSLYNLDIHFPARFIALAQVGLVVVAANAVASFSGRVRVFATLLAVGNVIDICARGVVGYPLSRTELPHMDELHVLADHQGHALLDLSYLWLDNLDNRHTALAAQMNHEHPVNTIALERVDLFDRHGLDRTCALRLPHKLHADFVGLSNLAVPDFDVTADLYMLQEWGFRELMIGLPAGKVPDRLNEFLGEPSIQTEEVIIWNLPSVEATRSEADSWTKEYKRRLRHVQENGCPFERSTPPINAR